VAGVLCTIHYTVQASAGICFHAFIYEDGTAQKCFSFNWNPVVFCYYTFFSVLLQTTQNPSLKRRRKQETSTEDWYGSEDYVSEVREWWIREITGLIHSGNSCISSVILQKCTTNW